MAEERLLDVHQVCELLGVSRSTLHVWTKRGFMPSPIRVGPKLIRWERQSLLDWLKSGGKRTMQRCDEASRLRDEAQAAGLRACFMVGCCTDEPIAVMGEELGTDAEAEAEVNRDVAASN
jgi:excisionase family DNA binding protein